MLLGSSSDIMFAFSQPHSPDNRAFARECKDVKIDRVYIGSCTGGKTEDFMAAAKVFLASVSIIYSCCQFCNIYTSAIQNLKCQTGVKFYWTLVRL